MGHNHSHEHTANGNILEVEGLSTHFFTSTGVIKAVSDLSFSLKQNSCLALIGESGAGKSVTALSLLRLITPPGRIVSGKICLAGRDLLRLTSKEMRQARGEEISIMFQDPLASFNPVMTVGAQIKETIRAHRRLPGKEAVELALEKLEGVSLPARRVYHSFPFQLSGGMRQRAALAMALSLHPHLLIADEPTTFLDVTLQRQILQELQRQLAACCLSLLFITHDLAAAAAVADKVAVLYAGRLVEYGSLQEVFAEPLHPYTTALLRSHPSLAKKGRLQPVQGRPPSPYNQPAGCPFLKRCPDALTRCREQLPVLMDLGGERKVACHRYNPRNERVQGGLLL